MKGGAWLVLAVSMLMGLGLTIGAIASRRQMRTAVVVVLCLVRRHRSLKRSRINQIAHHTEYNFQYHSHHISTTGIWICPENNHRIKSNQRKPKTVNQHRPWKKWNLIIHRTFYVMDPALKKLTAKIQ